MGFLMTLCTIFLFTLDGRCDEKIISISFGDFSQSNIVVATNVNGDFVSEYTMKEGDAIVLNFIIINRTKHLLLIGENNFIQLSEIANSDGTFGLPWTGSSCLPSKFSLLPICETDPSIEKSKIAYHPSIPYALPIKSPLIAKAGKYKLNIQFAMIVVCNFGDNKIGDYATIFADKTIILNIVPAVVGPQSTNATSTP